MLLLVQLIFSTPVLFFTAKLAFLIDWLSARSEMRELLKSAIKIVFGDAVSQEAPVMLFCPGASEVIMIDGDNRPDNITTQRHCICVMWYQGVSAG